MEYKVGDKVICKENFQTFDSKIFRFLRNKSYFITDIYITYGDCEYVQLYVMDFNDVCNITKKTYDKYFYNNKEIRKMKLKMINGIKKVIS